MAEDRLLERLHTGLKHQLPRRLPEEICPQRAAVAVVLAQPAYLLVAMIRRTEHPLDPWSGQMGFPGGRAAPEDVDAWDTAIREAEEEVGLDLRRAERLGMLPDIQALSGGKPLPMAITPVVFHLAEQQPLAARSEEVAEALWVPLAALRDPRRAVVVPRTYAGRTYELPGVDYEGRLVWGLTHRMLASLFALLED